MFGFGWIKKLLKGNSVDSWRGCNKTFYVFALREQLDKIADDLSFKDGRAAVYSRFDRKRGCAELYTRSGDIVAMVYGCGRANRTTDAIVASNLPMESLEIFKKHISCKVILEKLWY